MHGVGQLSTLDVLVLVGFCPGEDTPALLSPLQCTLPVPSLGRAGEAETSLTHAGEDPLLAEARLGLAKQVNSLCFDAGVHSAVRAGAHAFVVGVLEAAQKAGLPLPAKFAGRAIEAQRIGGTFSGYGSRSEKVGAPTDMSPTAFAHWNRFLFELTQEPAGGSGGGPGLFAMMFGKAAL